MVDGLRGCAPRRTPCSLPAPGASDRTPRRGRGWRRSRWRRILRCSCCFSCWDGGEGARSVARVCGCGGGAHRQDERRRAQSTDHDEPPDRFEAVDDAPVAPRKATVRATPKVPPNWRTAWAAAPPTPARPGGSAWATTLESCGKTSATPRPLRSMDGRKSPRVADVGSERDKPEQAAAGEQGAAGDEQRSLADAAGEFAGPRGDESDHDRAGGDSEAGLEHRPLPDVGEEEDRAEEQGGEGSAEQQHGEVGPPEVGDVEQVEVEGGRLGVLLVDDEHGEHGEPCEQDAEGADAEPSVVVGADEAVGQQPGRGDDQDDPDEGWDLRVRVGRLVEALGGRRSRCRCRPAG